MPSARDVQTRSVAADVNRGITNLEHHHLRISHVSHLAHLDFSKKEEDVSDLRKVRKSKKVAMMKIDSEISLSVNAVQRWSREHTLVLIGLSRVRDFFFTQHFAIPTIGTCFDNLSRSYRQRKDDLRLK